MPSTGIETNIIISEILDNTFDIDERMRVLQGATAAYKSLYYGAYYDLCRKITGRDPSKRPPEQEEFLSEVKKYFENRKEELSKTLCEDLGYCEKRKKLGSEVAMLEGMIILAGLIMEVLACGMVSALWLISSNALDGFCGCNTLVTA